MGSPFLITLIILLLTSLTSACHRLGLVPRPAPTSSPNPVAQTSRKNAELLGEMYADIFMSKPTDLVEFASLVDAMNQGASLEGIYNGLIHSRAYLALETNQPAVKDATFKIFMEAYESLDSELPQKQLLGALDPTSLFHLKALLSAQAFRVVEAKRARPGELAAWYGKWAAHLAEKKVDFGIAQRNSANEKFHFNWAMHASVDQLQWEVLNRLHRLMNFTESGKK